MLTPQTQAILLLTAHFSKAASDGARPLTIREWGKFALWLKDHQLSPDKLLTGSPATLLEGWNDAKISIERLTALLNRGSALALAAEKWSRAGLWVMTRSDKDYPRRLKDRLGHDAPPVLFGCGNRTLLNRGGLAVVGSRNTSQHDLDYSTRLGELCANNGLNVISGGAKGVDETAMLGTLQAEGMATGVLANDLLRTATAKKYRPYLMSNNLVLICPFHPEAGFQAGNAMQRNKYIYCLADTAIAVHSGTKGGTWEGVQENLKKGWVPMWIKPTDDPEAGNAALVQKGARWLPDTLQAIDLHSLGTATHDTANFNTSNSHAIAEPRPGLFTIASDEEAQAKADKTATPARVSEDSTTQGPSASDTTLTDDSESPVVSSTENPSDPATGETDALAHKKQLPDSATTESEQPQSEKDLQQALLQHSLYELFVAQVQLLTADQALSAEELLEHTGLLKTQLNAWLKQATEKGHLEKLSRPVRYQKNKIHQTTMF